MRTYVLRRLLQTIPLLFGISLITFLLLQLAPGDFLNQMAENPGISAETIEAMRVRFGLDKPWYVQYGDLSQERHLLLRFRPVVCAPPAGVRGAERRLHQHADAGGRGRVRHVGARDSARRARRGEAALVDRSHAVVRRVHLAVDSGNSRGPAAVDDGGAHRMVPGRRHALARLRRARRHQPVLRHRFTISRCRRSSSG